MLAFRTHPLLALTVDLDLLSARGSLPFDVYELPVSTQRSTESPVPELRFILFAFKNMYTIPLSLCPPSPHRKDTPARNIHHHSH